MQQVSPDDRSDTGDETVVDSQVLAERRARRGEAGETLRDRATAAEKAAVSLERRLADTEARLSHAQEERTRLATRLERVEKDLTAARQREFAEQRARVEAEGEAGSTRRETQREIARLRSALESAQSRAAQLEADVEPLREELREARLAATEGREAALADDADIARLEGELAAARAELQLRLQDITRAEISTAGRQGDFSERHDDLVARAEGLERLAAELEAELQTESDLRLAAERSLHQERSRAQAEITLLQHELDRRADVSAQVGAQVAALRGELDTLRDAASDDADRSAGVQARLVEAAAAEERLRDALARSEAARAASDVRADDALTRLSAREAELAEARTSAEHAQAHLRLAQEEADKAVRGLADAEGRLATLRAAADTLRNELDSERAARRSREAELEAQIVEEREAFAMVIGEERATFRAELEQHRAAFAAQVEAVERGLAGLRGTAGIAVAQAREDAQAEKSLRQRAEADLEASERAREAAERVAGLAQAEHRETLTRLEAEQAACDARTHELEKERDAALGEREHIEAQLRAAKDALAAAQALAVEERMRLEAAQRERAAADAAASVADAAATEARNRAEAMEAKASADLAAAHAAAEQGIAEARAAADRSAAEARALAEQGVAEAREAVAARQAAEAELESARAEAAAAVAALASAEALTAQATSTVAEQRARAEEAEAARDAAAAELERREALEADVQRAVTALRNELEALRGEQDGQREREAELEKLVSDLVGTADSLREGFARELNAAAVEREAAVSAEREAFRTELAKMEERVGLLRQELSAAAASLSEQLEAEARARAVAEQALAIERARLADVEAEARASLDAHVAGESAALERVTELEAALQAHLAREDAALARVAELEAELAAPARTTIPAPDHPALSEKPAPADDASDVIASLGAAAQRLRGSDASTPSRAQTGEDDAADHGRQPAGGGDTTAAEPQAAAADPERPADGPEGLTGAPADGPVADRPDPTAESALAAWGAKNASEGPVADPEPTGELPPPVAERGLLPSRQEETELPAAYAPGDRRGVKDWLTPALIELAGRDEAAAARVVLAGAPVLAARARKPATFVLALGGHGTHRVSLTRDRQAIVEAILPGEAGAPEFSITGAPRAVAVLAGGAAGKQLPEAEVQGRKRRARRLLKVLSQPVGLGELGAAGSPLELRDALQLLALAVPAEQVGELTGTVAFAAGIPPLPALRVADGGLSVVEITGPQADAVVHPNLAGWLPVLAGEAPVKVSGDAEIAGRVLSLLRAVQR